MTAPGIDATALDQLSAGALALAAGAEESSTRAMRDWTLAALRQHGPVPLVSHRDLTAGQLCAAVSLVGSSAALSEQLPAGQEPLRAVRALEHRLGGRIGVVVALNTAAENALLAVVTAAVAGVPLLDGDGCGRVLPLLEQTTFTLAGIPVAPLAVAFPSGGVVLLDTGGEVEALVRPVVQAAGGWAVAVGYAMTGEQLASAAVPGTVTIALAAGRAIGEGKRPPARGQRLGRGRVEAVEHPAPRSAADQSGHPLPSSPTSIVIAETSAPHRRFRLEAHNEVLLAFADGAPIAAAPDQILMVTTPGQRVLDVERVLPGIEVDLVVLAADPAWHTGEGRRLARAGSPLLDVTATLDSPRKEGQ